MKRIIYILLLAVWGASEMRAQTPAELHQLFVQALNGGADKAQLYNALYLDYNANLDQLKSAAIDSAPYREAKTTLLSIWPYLENAAVYYSSTGNQSNAIVMAGAYIGLPKMDQFRGMDFNYSPNCAQLAYFVGSRYFNNREYAKALPYLDDYLKTGEEKNRKNVMMCAIKASKEVGDVQTARAYIEQAALSYPNDHNLLSMGINLCQEINDYQGLQIFIDKAIKVRPNDTAILNIQGQLYEDTRQYDKAVDIYKKLLQSNPNSLEINKHLGLNYYNAGALCVNKAVTETNSHTKKDLLKDAKEYFTQAIPVLEKVVIAEPSSVKYNTAMAVAYSQAGKNDKLETQNRKLASIGAGRVEKDAIPAMMAFNSNRPIGNNQAYTASTANVQSDTSVASQENAEIPKFSAYAKQYIEDNIKQWQAKDPYETADEYRARVTEDTRKEKVTELKKIAESNYLSQYGVALSPTQFSLKPYDAENEVFLIESSYGQLVVKVPRSNNEARLFEQNWNGVVLASPKYFIANDGLALSELTFQTPTGKSYTYTSDKALTYTETNVDVQFADIDYSSIARNTVQASGPKIEKQNLSVGTSDVDLNIPETNAKAQNTFAVIIANENYPMVAKVPHAISDGSSFSKYCEKTLGLPKSNILTFSDASYGMILSAVSQLKDIASAYSNDKFNVIFYYAGHGIPNEQTKDAYLLPIDANGQHTEVCYPLSKLYGELGNLGAQSVTVFIDACFSGAERQGGMLASARGIALKAKPETPKGNMVVFSAASGDETAYPYTEKGHGLFTYFLLKKLQETKGDVSYKELGDYITDNVKKTSVVINHKSQTPTVKLSDHIDPSWLNKKIRN